MAVVVMAAAAGERDNTTNLAFEARRVVLSTA